MTVRKGLSMKAWLLLATLVLFAGCRPGDSSTIGMKSVADDKQSIELVYYSWPEDATAAVFDDFTQETGIRVRHESYSTVDEAIRTIRSGQELDLAVMGSESIPQLIMDGALATLDFSHIPNFKYVSLNFRDLAYDPGNRHSVPFSWGTTGIVVRTDLVEGSINRWSDLWSPEYQGRVVLWKGQRRETLGLALRSLGYSANSEEPTELNEAMAHLLEITPNVIWYENEQESIAPLLISGTAVAGMGWAYDYWAAHEAGVPVAYVLPEDGAFLWNDNFVILANSPNKEAAETLIDFLLRPEIAAQVIGATYYPMAHDTARDFTEDEIRHDPVIFPEIDTLQTAELLMPLTADGQRLWETIWQLLLEKIP